MQEMKQEYVEDVPKEYVREIRGRRKKEKKIQEQKEQEEKAKAK